MPGKPCHYDVLGLERDASDEEIKRVYRRLALFWHPDKNTPEQRDEATDVFRLVTEAYAVLGDPKRREKYDRDGHPATAAVSAGAAAAAAAAASKSASRAASAPPAPPPAPAPAPAPVSAVPTPPHPQYVPEHAHGGWGGNDVGGGWEGMPVGGDYGQGWMPPQQHQYPFHQAPSPFMQQQQHFQQQGPFPHQQQQQFQQQGPFPQQQENAFAYDNQFAHQHQAYPFQQPQHQAQAPPPWGTYYEHPGAGGYGAPSPASVPPPLLPEAAPAPVSTELALPTELSPRGGAAAYPGGFPHDGFPQAEAVSHGMVAHPGVAHPGGGDFMHHHQPPPSHGTVVHRGAGGFPHQEAPFYDLPPVVVAPPSTYPPSSESAGSESESEDSEEDLAVVARKDSPPPVRTVTKTPSRSLFRRGPAKEPYPTETRYVPPQPERLNGTYYPKETRGQGEQQQRQYERSDSGSSGLVLKFHLGTKAPDRAAVPPAPTSVGPLVDRPSSRSCASTSSRGRSEGGMGGIIQEMDRMFANVMGGGLLGAGVSLGVAGDEGSGRGLNRSFSTGGGGGGGGGSRASSMSGGGLARASMMSSRTVVDGRSRTLFSRTERTVVNTDGTRETNVQEYRADSSRGAGSSRGSASHVNGSRGAGGSERSSSAGDRESQRSASTRRGSLRSFFGK